VTANLAEAVPAGPVLHDPAEPPALGPGELPLLRVRSRTRLPLDHQLVQQARRQTSPPSCCPPAGAVLAAVTLQAAPQHSYDALCITPVSPLLALTTSCMQPVSSGEQRMVRPRIVRASME